MKISLEIGAGPVGTMEITSEDGTVILQDMVAVQSDGSSWQYHLATPIVENGLAFSSFSITVGCVSPIAAILGK